MLFLEWPSVSFQLSTGQRSLLQPCNDKPFSVAEIPKTSLFASRSIILVEGSMVGSSLAWHNHELPTQTTNTGCNDFQFEFEHDIAFGSATVHQTLLIHTLIRQTNCIVNLNRQTLLITYNLSWSTSHCKVKDWILKSKVSGATCRGPVGTLVQVTVPDRILLVVEHGVTRVDQEEMVLRWQGEHGQTDFTRVANDNAPDVPYHKSMFAKSQKASNKNGL